MGYFQVIFATLIWGSYGLFVRHLEYPPELILFFRYLLGFLFLFVLAYRTKKLLWTEAIRHWRKFILIGAFSASSWYAYTFSLTYTSVANAVFLLYTAPCFVIIFSPFLLKEKVEKNAILALMVSLLGMTIIMKGSGMAFSANSWVGDTISLASGLFYALSMIMIKKLPSHLLGITVNMYVACTACMFCLPMAARHMHLIQVKDFSLLIALGILQQGVATTLYYAALRHIKITHASILTYLDPVFSVFFAFIFLQEIIGLSTLVGGLVVLLGGIIIVNSSAKDEVGSKTAALNTTKD
ncbi:MAG: DMT family transporter [Dehalobacterium sp.]